MGQVSLEGRIWASYNKKEVHKLVNINKVLAQKAGVDVEAIVPTLNGYYDVLKMLQAVGGDGFYALNTVITVCMICSLGSPPWGSNDALSKMRMAQLPFPSLHAMVLEI